MLVFVVLCGISSRTDGRKDARVPGRKSGSVRRKDGHAFCSSDFGDDFGADGDLRSLRAWVRRAFRILGRTDFLRSFTLTPLLAGTMVQRSAGSMRIRSGITRARH